MDPHAQPVTPFLSPWTERLFAAIAATEGHLLLVSPYIKEGVMAAIEGAQADRRAAQPLSIRVLTRVRLDDLLSGSSDIAALEWIIGWPVAHPGWTVDARALDNVHAKVWVMDEIVAFVGSGNATGPGLEGNIEYGVELREHDAIARILADWNALWEQGTPITTEALTPFRQALDAVKMDETLLTAQATLDQRREALVKRITASSRIGTSLPIAKSGLLPSTARARPAPLLREPRDHFVPLADETASDEPATASSLIETRLDHALKALHWVIPHVSDADDSTPQLDLFSALKITCERVDLDPRTRFGRTTFPSQVRLTWADHVRDVEATLVAFVIESEDVDAPVRGPWAVTLGAEAIRRLAELLFRYQDQALSEPNAALALRLSVESSHARLSTEIWRVILTGEDLKEYAEETLLDSLTMGVTPASWDQGFQEITSSAVTAKLYGRDLDRALAGFASLASSGEVPIAVDLGATSEVVEVRLGDAFDAPAILLRPAGAQGTAERAVLLYDLKGSSVPAFRTDQQALFQMARFQGVAGNAQAWVIRIPPHAGFIEFEPTCPLVSDGFISLTRWRSRLRNVEA